MAAEAEAASAAPIKLESVAAELAQRYPDRPSIEGLLGRANLEIDGVAWASRAADTWPLLLDALKDDDDGLRRLLSRALEESPLHVAVSGGLAWPQKVSFGELAEELAGLYLQKESSQALLRRAKIRQTQIPFAGTPLDNWVGILAAVHRMGQWEPLLKRLRHENSENELLERAEAGVDWQIPESAAGGDGGSEVRSVLVQQIVSLASGFVFFLSSLLTVDPTTHYNIALLGNAEHKEAASGPGFLATLGTGVFGHGWANALGVLLIVLLIGMGGIFLALRGSGRLPWTLKPAHLRLAVAGVVAVLLAIAADVGRTLPRYWAAGELEGLERKLKFKGQFPPSTDEPSTGAELYSWLHGMKIDPEPVTSPVSILQGTILKRPAPWQEGKNLTPALKKVEGFYGDLVQRFVYTFLVFVLTAVGLAILLPQFQGHLLFGLLVLLLVVGLLIGCQLHYLQETHARAFLTAVHFQGEEMKKKPPQGEEPNQWPFIELDFADNLPLDGSSRVRVGNFWPLARKTFYGAFVCTTDDETGDFVGDWVPFSADKVVENDEGLVELELGPELYDKCCKARARGLVDLRFTDGLASHEGGPALCK